jgi:hypothetical protein
MSRKVSGRGRAKNLLPGVLALPRNDPRRVEFEKLTAEYTKQNRWTHRTLQRFANAAAVKLGVRAPRYCGTLTDIRMAMPAGIPPDWPVAKILAYKKRVDRGQPVLWRVSYADGRPAGTKWRPLVPRGETGRPKRGPGRPRKLSLEQFEAYYNDHPDLSDRQLASGLSRKFGIKIARETIWNWRRQVRSRE